MTGGLKPYTAYKGSGLPWLEQVPEHWTLLPNRALIRRRKLLVGARHSEYRLLSLTKEGVIVRDVESGKGKFSADMGTSQEVRAGDLVFCFFDVPETPRTVGLSPYDGMITGAYTVFECSNPHISAFLDLFYRAMDDRKLLSPLYSGLRNIIPPTRFLGTKTPLPPDTEQASIVRYLAHADGRIRSYIHVKQKLIKLLEEQRQAIINRAVTRGLNPNVRLRTSGVEWLGQVPEHWDVKRCRYLFREIDERSAHGSEQHLSMSQRLGLVPSHLVENRTLVSESYAGGKVCKIGDLVLNRLKAHLGVFSLSGHAGVISPDYTVLRPVESGGTAYFEQVLRSPACRRELRIRAKGIVEGFWRLYTDDFYDIRLPVPPITERQAIVAHNGRATADIQRAVSRAVQEISLLREFRMRLIADVATGKLDVREAAAGLPQGASDAKPLDETEDMPQDESAVDGGKFEAAE